MDKIFVFISTLIIIFFSTAISRGAPYWIKTYGGQNAFSIQQTLDGGYVIADGGVLKLEGNGDISWQKNYLGSNAISINSTRQTSDAPDRKLFNFRLNIH